MTCRAVMALPRQRLVRRFSSSPKCTKVPGRCLGSSGAKSESLWPHPLGSRHGGRRSLGPGRFLVERCHGSSQGGHPIADTS